jgi:predicted PurR-regulated permease PerM
VAEVRTNPPAKLSPGHVAEYTAIVLLVVLGAYLVYALRQPLTLIFISVFLAIALARPVRFFEERMRRGLAITVVYLLLVGIPILLGALLIPPIVRSIADFAENVPQYAADLQQFVNDNQRLQDIDEEFDVTGKLQEQAAKLPDQVGAAAGTLGDIGAGIVNSAFQLVLIMILTAFLLGSGQKWYLGFIEMQPEHRRDRLRRVLERSAGAVSGYVAGALVQATVAAVTALIILSILGVPFAAALAVVMFFADLVPVVGATIGAVIIGIFTIFADFPTATIVWVIYSIVYQQFENSVIQPQIQKRTVNVNGFIVVVSVLFGSALFGILGALVAIPIAASIQIALREWWAWRAEQREADTAVTSTG